ncbi:TMV resistance protein N [Arachis hypogaea]|nr:TMV resistance protein N [Arachis hypogaea]
MPENTMCSLVLEAKILATVSLATSLMLSVTKEFTTSLMMASFKVERKSHMHFSRQFKSPGLPSFFGEVMTKLENKYKNVMNKVDTWKKALKEVASLSGHHFKDGHRYEHEIIKNIVEDISIKIGRLPLPVADFPVGLEFPVSKVISLLEMDSTDQVHMERIHGIGGIGKITLALALYNLIADNFEGKEGVKIIGVKEGISQIQRRLSQIKVLLILDDIDEHE